MHDRKTLMPLLLVLVLVMGCQSDPAKQVDEKTAGASTEVAKPETKPEKAAVAEKTAEEVKTAEPPTTALPDGKGGQLIKSEMYKVKFTVPEGWIVEKNPTGISASSPDKGILMVVAGSKSQDLAEAALNDLKKNLKFKDVNIQKQGTTAINGLLGIRGEGDAVLVHESGESVLAGDAKAKEGDAKVKEGDAKAKEAKNRGDSLCRICDQGGRTSHYGVTLFVQRSLRERDVFDRGCSGDIG